MLTLLSIAIAFLFLSGNKQPTKVRTQKGSFKEIMYIAGTIGLLRALQYSILMVMFHLNFCMTFLDILVRTTIQEVFHIFSFHKKSWISKAYHITKRAFLDLFWLQYTTKKIGSISRKCDLCQEGPFHTFWYSLHPLSRTIDKAWVLHCVLLSMSPFDFYVRSCLKARFW